jgi:hypothetical protein
LANQGYQETSATPLTGGVVSIYQASRPAS